LCKTRPRAKEKTWRFAARKGLVKKAAEGIMLRSGHQKGPPIEKSTCQVRVAANKERRTVNSSGGNRNWGRPATDKSSSRI